MASSTKTISAPVIALLIGAAMWGVVWYPMRLLESEGLSGLWLTLIIYFSALLATLPFSYRSFPELIGAPGTVVPLAIAAGWTNVAFVLAILDGNVMRVLLLFYLSPLWAVILGYVFLKERPSRLAWITIWVAIAGAALMLWHPELGIPWPHNKADWLAMTSGFAFAVSNVVVRKAQNVSLETKVTATWIGVLVLSFGLIILARQPMPVFTTSMMFGAVALGILGILVMTTLVQYGVTRMPVHRSAVILLFELVAGAISQQLLTSETMTVVEWTGGVLIVTAAFVSSRS
ncbi:MAG: DMT family transporter [Gammaproteobacteria bacterium]|nr:DMT family transporter [Gammaproteobacteria bacterium]